MWRDKKTMNKLLLVSYNRSMKLLLGILIGLGVTFTGVVLADQWGYTGQKWSVPDNSGYVYKVRDGKVVCYVMHSKHSRGIVGAISCLVEPK